MTGAHFVRSPATVVLRDLPMNSDLSPETITPYIPPGTPNADNLIFEATGKLICYCLCTCYLLYWHFSLLSPIHFVSLFFGLASSVEIPEAESLLHADCNEQEVICELSRYNTRGAKPDSMLAHFIASVQLDGGGVGFTLVLQTMASENAESNTGSLKQSKLQLPLSQWGTLITEGYYSVKLLLFLELYACL